jgi:hypothetical protein
VKRNALVRFAPRPRSESNKKDGSGGSMCWRAGEVLDRRDGDTDGDQDDHGQDGRRRHVLATVDVSVCGSVRHAPG